MPVGGGLVAGWGGPPGGVWDGADQGEGGAAQLLTVLIDDAAAAAEGLDDLLEGQVVVVGDRKSVV